MTSAPRPVRQVWLISLLFVAKNSQPADLCRRNARAPVMTALK
jgi:hypothetical protein